MKLLPSAFDLKRMTLVARPRGCSFYRRSHLCHQGSSGATPSNTIIDTTPLSKGLPPFNASVLKCPPLFGGPAKTNRSRHESAGEARPFELGDKTPRKTAARPAFRQPGNATPPRDSAITPPIPPGTTVNRQRSVGGVEGRNPGRREGTRRSHLAAARNATRRHRTRQLTPTTGALVPAAG